MELLKLAGVVFVIIGFILKWDTIATVVSAGVITGLVAVMNGDMTFIQIFETLGSSFIAQRTSTLFVLSIGIIGISERYGLKDKAKDLIGKLKNITVGKFVSIWLLIRSFAAAFSLRLGGHVQFVRPLILPMAEGAVAAKYGEVDEKTLDQVKGITAASENYGNFFGQNCFMGNSGTLLIVNTMVAQGYQVDALQIAGASWYAFFAMLLIACASFLLYDGKLKAKFTSK